MAEAYENVIREMFGDKPTLPDDLMAVVKARMQRGLVSDITVADEMLVELARYRDAAEAQRDRSHADFDRMDAGEAVPLDETLANIRTMSEAERSSGT